MIKWLHAAVAIAGAKSTSLVRAVASRMVFVVHDLTVIVVRELFHSSPPARKSFPPCCWLKPGAEFPCVNGSRKAEGSLGNRAIDW